MRSKKGVTLVALVVTIIILLILAAVTISLTLGQDGIITKAQQAGKNYLNAQEYEQQQLAEFTNQTENIINNTTGGRNPYDGSEFRKSIAAAITEAGVETSEEDTDETIIANIGKIFQERTKDATATADNITAGKTAWVNGELVTGNGADNNTYYSLGKSNSGKSGVITSVPYEWVDIELGFKPKSVVIGIEFLASIYYDEDTSSSTWHYASADCGWYNLGSIYNTIGFNITDNGFRILRNYNDSLTFYYVAI